MIYNNIFIVCEADAASVVLSNSMMMLVCERAASLQCDLSRRFDTPWSVELLRRILLYYVYARILAHLHSLTCGIEHFGNYPVTYIQLLYNCSYTVYAVVFMYI